jgi:hypothetical protein
MENTMQANIERIESGPACCDKTAGSNHADTQELKRSIEQYRTAYDVMDMTDSIDAEALALCRAGDSQALGALLIARMNATVLRQAMWWESV